MPLLWIVLTLVVVASDYLTGPFISFPIVTMIPVVVASWYSGAWWGIGIGIFSAASRAYFLSLWTTPYTEEQVFINAIIRCLVFSIVAFLVSRYAKQSKNLHRQAVLIDLSPDAIMVRALDGAVKLWSKGAEKLYGWTKEEATGQKAHSLLQTEFPEPLEKIIEHLSNGRDWTGELVQKTKDGRTRVVQSFWHPEIRDTEAEIFDSNVDITDRKHAEEKLSLLSQAIESAANSIILTDREGRILWVNAAFTKLTGYSVDEIVGQNPKILKSGKQPCEFYRSLWETILRGEVWHGQLVNRRKDGSAYDEEMTITPVRAQGSDITHFVGVKENITERKRWEEELQDARMSAERAKAAAEDANKSKDHFLAVLSHELRTPLAPVLAAAQLIQRKSGLTDDLRGPLDIIRRNVQLEARLIDDLLDLTRIVHGKLSLEQKSINITTLIQHAVETCKPDVEARKLRLCVDMKDGPYRVNGDAVRLQQVVWNLLNNSIKFTPDGGCVGIRCHRDTGRVIVEVVDTGIGIEPGDRARIFDAFEQGGRPVTRQFGGLGLGCPVCAHFVHYTSRRNRVPPRRGFRVEVQ